MSELKEKEIATVYPKIISASKLTDIPSFFADKFHAGLNKGELLWKNPYNNDVTKVSFSECKCIVFWTKNMLPMEKYLQKVLDGGIEFYIQYTINDYEKERLEPNIPSLTQRIESFKRLSMKYGKERVIWRFDPIIMSNELDVESILGKINKLGQKLCPFTEKMVFSFIDMYPKTTKRLAETFPTMGYRQPTETEITKIANGLRFLNSIWEYPLELSTCAERVIDPQYGITKNACIDGELVQRLLNSTIAVKSNHSKKREQASLFGDEMVREIFKKAPNPQTRRECGCVEAKDIGEYGTCKNGCVYCYA